jgi:hypothetical protein
MAQQPTYKNRKRAAHEGGQQPVYWFHAQQLVVCLLLKSVLGCEIAELELGVNLVHDD